jgi:hypothetical protein
MVDTHCAGNLVRYLRIDLEFAIVDSAIHCPISTMQKMRCAIMAIGSIRWFQFIDTSNSKP